MQGARHTAGFRGIDEQSQCNWPHQALGSPWAQSAIWREWKHRHREGSQTSKEGNARINKVSAMKPGLAKIIEKVRISRYFASSETHHHMVENACSIDYADTWSSKRVHWLSLRRSSDRGITDYGCEDTTALNTGVARVRPPVKGIHMCVAPKSKIHWFPATFHNSR